MDPNESREEGVGSGEKRPWFFEHFPSLHDSDSFFDRIIQQDQSGRRIVNQLLMLVMLAFIYGAAMGAYHSVLQAVAAGVKVAVLLVLTLAICFPAFYIVQYILGSRLRFSQMVAIVLTGFILMTAMMVSFLPIIVIFLLTGGNYYFLQLLHIGVFILCGIFGMNTIVRALKHSCEKRNVYPQTGVVVFRFWVVILAFVAVQTGVELPTLPRRSWPSVRTDQGLRGELLHGAHLLGEAVDWRRQWRRQWQRQR